MHSPRGMRRLKTLLIVPREGVERRCCAQPAEEGMPQISLHLTGSALGYPIILDTSNEERAINPVRHKCNNIHPNNILNPKLTPPIQTHLIPKI